MPLSLKQEQGIIDIAGILYDFLPGSGSSAWEGHVTFGTVATKVGVGRFWQKGSKRPAITALLSQTLDREARLFERLVLEIVRAGINYRQKEHRPITSEEIEHLNGALLGVGFKFRELWESDFHAMLRMDEGARAKSKMEAALSEEKLRVTAQSNRAVKLDELKTRLFKLSGQADRQAAGLALEHLLTELFALEGLSPSEPFRVVGEQLDGSFELDHETYLVEAKWERDPVPAAPLYIFRSKVESKSTYTRGLFLSLSGVTSSAAQAIVTGMQPNFFVADGYDLTMVLSHGIDLVEFLRRRRRLLSEKGKVVVAYQELWTA